MIGHPMRWRAWAELHRRELERRRKQQQERIALLVSGAAALIVGVSAWLIL